MHRTECEMVRTAHAQPELRPGLLPFLQRWSRERAAVPANPELERLMDAEREFIAALTRVYMKKGLGRFGRTADGAVLRMVDQVVNLALEESQGSAPTESGYF